MPHIESVTLGVPDPTAAEAFYTAAFGIGDRVKVRASDEPTTGFRGYAMSLVVAQPNIVDSLVGTALDAGATTLKPATKGFWGYGAVVTDPTGTIWKIASSSKKNTGPQSRKIDELVLLLGVDDVAVTKRFYVEQGFAVAKSYGRKYVEFATTNVRLGLYGRRAAAKDVGVSPEGTGSHRIAVTSDAGAFTDPDGFKWEATSIASGQLGSAVAHPGDA